MIVLMLIDVDHSFGRESVPVVGTIRPGLPDLIVGGSIAGGVVGRVPCKPAGSKLSVVPAHKMEIGRFGIGDCLSTDRHGTCKAEDCKEDEQDCGKAFKRVSHVCLPPLG